jgi:hypothetical protein
MKSKIDGTKEVFDTISPGDCVKSNEEIFEKDSPNLLFFDTRKYVKRLMKHSRNYSFVINSASGQFIDAASVKKARENFMQNEYLKKYIKCSCGGGSFNFNSSIHEIFKNPKCAGIRYYFGFKRNNQKGFEEPDEIRIEIVGVDDTGEILGIWRENSFPHFP